MDIELERAAKDGDIDALYELIKREPFVLERLDKIPFVKTPLHIAAAAGHTLFACEIMILKPSFSKKLDPDGFSPLHLALQSSRIETAKRLVEVNPELIRVRGKGGLTPLLYLVGELNEEDANLDILAEFLLAKPSSMHDVTIRGESALHLAMKKKKAEALKMLVGWLKWTSKEYMLDWKDMNGNTVLHIALDTDQTQVIKTVTTRENKDIKNLKGLTPLDIVSSATHNKDKARKILQGSHKATSLPTMKLSDFFRSSPNILEKFFFHMAYLQGLPMEVHNSLLSVALSIIAITYQGMLSPPRGVIPLESQNTATLENSTVEEVITRATNFTISLVGNCHFTRNWLPLESEPYSQSSAGTAETKLKWFQLYENFNTLAFCLSVILISAISCRILPHMMIFLPVELLMFAYFFAIYSMSLPIVSPTQFVILLYLVVIPIAVFFRTSANRKFASYLRRQIIRKVAAASARETLREKAANLDC